MLPLYVCMYQDKQIQVKYIESFSHIFFKAMFDLSLYIDKCLPSRNQQVTFYNSFFFFA